jgi:DNA mismatch repair protein MutS
LFRAAPPPPPPQKQKTSAVEERLKDIHPDELTPMEALKLIYEIKGLA